MNQPMWLNAVRAMPIVLALSTSLAAQWAPYPTSGVPKGPDGKPNLTAPTPKTADGKPDFSGIWEPVRPPVPLPNKKPEFTPEGYPYAIFFDVSPGKKLPAKPWVEELMKKRIADDFKDHPDANCMPLGIMLYHTHPQPRKIVQVPGLLLTINEANYGLRQIYTDGRSIP